MSQGWRQGCEHTGLMRYCRLLHGGRLASMIQLGYDLEFSLDSSCLPERTVKGEVQL